MNSYEIISNVIVIGLQIYFYLETDMIMQSNMALRSYTAFSCLSRNIPEEMFIF